jgi:hypothetical protein
MPSRATEPCQEGGRALEHPSLGSGAEHPRQQPVVCELALEVGELDARPAAGKRAKAIGDRLAERSWVGVPSLGHRPRASATSASRFDAPVRRRSSSRSATPLPRSSPNRWACGATALTTTLG